MTDTLAQMQADIDKALLAKLTPQTESTCSDESNLGVTTPNPPATNQLNEVEVSRIIEMAWEDRTPFDSIQHTYGLDESAVIDLMRREMKPSSFKMWRKRVSNRATKHTQKRGFEFGRAHCKTQYKPR